MADHSSKYGALIQLDDTVAKRGGNGYILTGDLKHVIQPNSYSSPNNQIILYFPKGTTLEQAKEKLVGTKLLYVAKEEYYVTKDLNDYNNILSCYEDGHIQVEYENIMPDIEISYPQNTAGQLNSNSTSIASMQKENNLLWNAIFLLTQEMKKIKGDDESESN